MDTSSWLNRTFESIGSLGSFGSFSQGDERQRGSDVHEHEDLECDMDVDDDVDDDVESQYSTLKRHPSSNHIEHSCGRDSEMKHTRTLSYTNQESEWDRLYRSQELEMEEKSPVKLDEKLTLMDYIWKEKWAEAALRCKTYPVEPNSWSEAKTKKGAIMWRKLPIHAALKMGKYEDASYYDCICSLLLTFPESARFGDENGDLPLHLAAGCKNVSSPKLVNFVISRYPGAITRTNKRGMLPLHRAYAGGAPHEVLEVVYNAYPGAAQVLDNRRKLPIQYSKVHR